jgi:hypothetical protein
MKWLKSLRRFIFGDKVTLPPLVKQRIEEHKKEREYYVHFFCKILYKNQSYYLAQYTPQQGYIVVKEDGMIPPLAEIEPVLWMALSADSMAMTIQRTGKIWAKATTRYHERILKLLNRIDRRLRSSMPLEIQSALDAFIEVSRTFIEKQEVVREYYQKGNELVEHLFETHELTQEIYDQLYKYKTEMWKAAYLQTKIQVDTYEVREKLLKYLFDHVSVTSPGLLMTELELNYHHRKLANPHKKIADEIKELEPYHEEIVNHWGKKGFRSTIDLKEEEKVLPLVRNPR